MSELREAFVFQNSSIKHSLKFLHRMDSRFTSLWAVRNNSLEVILRIDTLTHRLRDVPEVDTQIPEVSKALQNYSSNIVHKRLVAVQRFAVVLYHHARHLVRHIQHALENL